MSKSDIDISQRCSRIADTYQSDIQDVVLAQVEDQREAIFFIYEDGTTSNIYRGTYDGISLSEDEERRIMNQGTIAGSVHSHPTKYDPSTIDIMTGTMSQQESMCVATPAYRTPDKEDFVLTCLDLSELGPGQRAMLTRAMRRSSLGVTEVGRNVRKQAALKRFRVRGCRSAKIKSGVQGDFLEDSGESEFEVAVME